MFCPCRDSAWAFRALRGIRSTLVWDSDRPPATPALLSGTATEWTLPAARLQNAAGSAHWSETAAAPPASCPRSRAAAPLPWQPWNRASACAETSPLPDPPGTQWETPAPWRCAASATKPARVNPANRCPPPAPRDPEIPKSLHRARPLPPRHSPVHLDYPAAIPIPDRYPLPAFAGIRCVPEFLSMSDAPVAIPPPTKAAE